MQTGVQSIFSNNDNLEPIKKNLVPKETVICKKNTTLETGEVIELTVYYGNYIEPQICGKYVTLKYEKYRKELDKFLKSEEGIEYRYPTEEDIVKTAKDTEKYLNKLAKGSVDNTYKHSCEQNNENNDKIKLNQSSKSGDTHNDNMEQKDTHSAGLTVDVLSSNDKDLPETKHNLKENKETEQDTKEKAKRVQEERLDARLQKALAVCLILSVCMNGILIFIYLIHK